MKCILWSGAGDCGMFWSMPRAGSPCVWAHFKPYAHNISLLQLTGQFFVPKITIQPWIIRCSHILSQHRYVSFLTTLIMAIFHLFSVIYSPVSLSNCDFHSSRDHVHFCLPICPQKLAQLLGHSRGLTTSHWGKDAMKYTHWWKCFCF